MVFQLPDFLFICVCYFIYLLLITLLYFLVPKRVLESDLVIERGRMV